MRVVIVTGGRTYEDKEKVNRVLNLLDPDLVVQGGASGADRLAIQWANSLIIPKSETFLADWSQYGPAAGPIRNRKMLDVYPKATVVAFPGGKGTADCVKAARERGMLVLEVS